MKLMVRTQNPQQQQQELQRRPELCWVSLPSGGQRGGGGRKGGFEANIKRNTHLKGKDGVTFASSLGLVSKVEL